MKKIFFGCLLALSVTLMSCEKSEKKSPDATVMTAEQFSDYVSKVTSDCKEIVSDDLTDVLASVGKAIEMYNVFKDSLPQITTEAPFPIPMMLAYLKGQPVYYLLMGGITGELPLQGTWNIDLYNRTGEYIPLAMADSASNNMFFSISVNPDTCYKVKYEGKNIISMPIDSTEWIEFPSIISLSMTMETTGNQVYRIFDIECGTELDPVRKVVTANFSAELGNTRQTTGGFIVCDTLATVSYSYLKDGKNMFNVEVSMPCKNLVSFMFDPTIPVSVSAMSMKFGFAQNALNLAVDNIIFDEQQMSGFDPAGLIDVLVSLLLESSSEEWPGISMEDLSDSFGISSQNLIMLFNSLNLSISIPDELGYKNPVAKIQMSDDNGYAKLYYVCADNSKVAVSLVPMFGYETIYQCIAAVVQKVMFIVMTLL